MKTYIQLYFVGLTLWLSVQNGFMIRIPAKLENSKGIGSSSNVEHQLDNERKPQYQQEQQYKSPPHSGLESEATDFSSHILSPEISDSDASLSSHYSSSSDDGDIGSYSQAAIHQVAQALTKAAEHVAQQHPQKYDDSELDDHHEEIPYQYHYKIKDVKGLEFGHAESKQGKITEGKYFVQLPDGRVKTVSYWADDSGYHADVQYEGKAKHPNAPHPPPEGSIEHHMPLH